MTTAKHKRANTLTAQDLLTQVNQNLKKTQGNDKLQLAILVQALKVFEGLNDKKLKGE